MDPYQYRMQSNTDHVWLPDGTRLDHHLEAETETGHYVRMLYADAHDLVHGRNAIPQIKAGHRKLGQYIEDTEKELELLKAIHANNDLWGSNLPNRTVYVDA